MILFIINRTPELTKGSQANTLSDRAILRPPCLLAKQRKNGGELGRIVPGRTYFKCCLEGILITHSIIQSIWAKGREEAEGYGELDLCRIRYTEGQITMRRRRERSSRGQKIIKWDGAGARKAESKNRLNRKSQIIS